VDATVFYSLGFVLIVSGIMVVVTAIILFSKSSTKKDRIRGAGIIMVGPIPIIFGTDKKSVRTVLTLELALTIIALIIIV
jgi:uncharacterized protein (TIGR00304 family)